MKFDLESAASSVAASGIYALREDEMHVARPVAVAVVFNNNADVDWVQKLGDPLPALFMIRSKKKMASNEKKE